MERCSLDHDNRALLPILVKDSSGQEQTLIFEIDTGNFCQLLTTDRWATAMGWSLDPSPQGLRSFSGASVGSRIAEIEIRWLDQWITVEIQVIDPSNAEDPYQGPSHGQPQGILGRALLSGCVLTIDYTNSRAEIRKI